MSVDLGNLLKLADPGALAHAAADAILPPDMQWLGGVLGAAVDLQCGNPFGAIKEGLDSIKDLNELSAQQKKLASSEPSGGWRHEPPPPPPRGSTTTVTATASATATTTATTTTVTASVSTSAAPSGQNLGVKAMASAENYIRGQAGSQPPPAQLPVSPAGPWHTPPSAVALRATPPASQAASTPAPGAWRQSPPSFGQSVIDTFRRAMGPQDPATMSKDQFMAMDNESFMKAIRDGKIPKEISDSPAAMQALQARMNQISEMNQLMTSMIQAMHQMQMAVIQNVRV